MEIKRTFNNGISLAIFLSILCSFVLGYVLLFTLDKESNIPLNVYFSSIYSVITQFGMLIFPAIIIRNITVDYSNHNISFYMLLGYDSLKYFFKKVFNVSLQYIFWIIVGSIVVSIVYKNDFSLTVPFILYCTFAIINVVLISSIIALVQRNILISTMLVLALWIIGVMISVSNDKLYWFAFFDSTSQVSINFINYLDNGISFKGMYMYPIVYITLLFIVTCIMSKLLKKRWLKNGN